MGTKEKQGSWKICKWWLGSRKMNKNNTFKRKSRKPMQKAESVSPLLCPMNC